MNILRAHQLAIFDAAENNSWKAARSLIALAPPPLGKHSHGSRKCYPERLAMSQSIIQIQPLLTLSSLLYTTQTSYTTVHSQIARVSLVCCELPRLIHETRSGSRPPTPSPPSHTHPPSPRGGEGGWCACVLRPPPRLGRLLRRGNPSAWEITPEGGRASLVRIARSSPPVPSGGTSVREGAAGPGAPATLACTTTNCPHKGGRLRGCALPGFP